MGDVTRFCAQRHHYGLRYAATTTQKSSSNRVIDFSTRLFQHFFSCRSARTRSATRADIFHAVKFGGPSEHTYNTANKRAVPRPAAWWSPKSRQNSPKWPFGWFGYPGFTAPAQACRCPPLQGSFLQWSSLSLKHLRPHRSHHCRVRLACGFLWDQRRPNTHNRSQLSGTF
jgi:hypothetical protein